jgi:hypothetical protein
MLRYYLERIPDDIINIIYQYHNPEYVYHDNGLLFNIVHIDNQSFLFGNFCYINLIEKLDRYVKIYPCYCDDRCELVRCCVCDNYIYDMSDEHLVLEDYSSICNSIYCFVKYCHMNNIDCASYYDLNKIYRSPYLYKWLKYDIAPPMELQDELKMEFIYKGHYEIIAKGFTHINNEFDYEFDTKFDFPYVSDVEQKYYPYCNELIVVGSITNIYEIITYMICGHQLDTLDTLEHNVSFDRYDDNYLTLILDPDEEVTFCTYIFIRRFESNRFTVEINYDLNNESAKYTQIEFNI